jgi:hypothetical protein
MGRLIQANSLDLKSSLQNKLIFKIINETSNT